MPPLLYQLRLLSTITFTKNVGLIFDGMFPKKLFWWIYLFFLSFPSWKGCSLQYLWEYFPHRKHFNSGNLIFVGVFYSRGPDNCLGRFSCKPNSASASALSRVFKYVKNRVYLGHYQIALCICPLIVLLYNRFDPNRRSKERQSILNLNWYLQTLFLPSTLFVWPSFRELRLSWEVRGNTAEVIYCQEPLPYILCTRFLYGFSRY